MSGASAPLHWSDIVPSPAEYVALRAATGLGERSEAAAARALPATLQAVTVWWQGHLIGMGRLVGDGGCFVQLVDMAVLPEWQGQGVGGEILTRLMDWAETHLPESCHLSLVSSVEAEPLYRSAGFERCLGMDRYAGTIRLSPLLEGI